MVIVKWVKWLSKLNRFSFRIWISYQELWRNTFLKTLHFTHEKTPDLCSKCQKLFLFSRNYVKFKDLVVCVSWRGFYTYKVFCVYGTDFQYQTPLSYNFFCIVLKTNKHWITHTKLVLKNFEKKSNAVSR